MRFVTIYCLACICLGSFGQNTSLNIHGTSGFKIGHQMPFWLISNQNGLYLNEPANLYGGFEYKHTLDSNKKIDFGYGTYLQLNPVAEPLFYPQELYAELKVFAGRITIGNKMQTIGNASHKTSSGNLIISNNARPLPKVEMAISEYADVPFTKGYLEVKGHFTNRWYADDRFTSNLMVHDKSIFGQLGGDYFINIHLGIVHAAQWGGSNDIYEDLPSAVNDLWWVVRARAGAPVDSLGGESENRYGNHIGSRLFGMDIKAKKWTLNLYWQTIFEDTSGKKMQNMADGLWGIHWSRKNANHWINDVTIEYVNTTHQSGPVHALEVDGEKRNFGGDDNYFNHYIYRSGWTHYGMTQGTPFITSPNLTNSDNIINNKSRTFYLSAKGKLKQHWEYITRMSYGLQYGVNLNNKTSYWDSIEPAESQFSAVLSLKYQSNTNHQFYGSLGIDAGVFLNQNIGLTLGYTLKIL